MGDAEMADAFFTDWRDDSVTMPPGPECRTDNGDGGVHNHAERATQTKADRSRLSRRRTLAAFGSISLGATAGCLDAVSGLASSQVTIEPEAPGNDPRGTPNEFYYLLKENGIAVADLYHDTDENTLSLFYESTAEDAVESDEEIGTIYSVFRHGLIERGSEITHLYTEVRDRFDGQVIGWGIDVDWVEQHRAGEITENQLWATIVKTKTYGDGDDEPNGQNETESDTDGPTEGSNNEDMNDDE